MLLESHILTGSDKNGKPYFINTNTGVKLELEIENKMGRLVPAKIVDADIEKAFQEDVEDIQHLKEINPTNVDINLFSIFMAEYLKQHKLFDLKRIK